ncbi:MAG: N-acetyltransferase family protein [Cyanobacteria bacterium P01_A01_bin.40]
MSLKIRNYLPHDSQAIADIYNQAILKGGITMDCEPYSAQQIAELVDKFDDREKILLAEIDNEQVGWGIIKKYSDRPGYRVCCETSIYLKFTETKKGYGQTLQTALLKQVKEFDYYHVVAKILAANQGSIRFHQKFGFELVGIQKKIGFYGGQWHDVAIMQLLLN